MMLSHSLVFFLFNTLVPTLSFANPVNLTAVSNIVLDGPEEYFASLCQRARLDFHISGRDDSWPPNKPTGYDEAIDMDHFQGSGTLGIWTFGLATCIGVGITGSPKNPESDDNARFLLHLPASTMFIEKTWPLFEAAVRGANLAGIKGYISTPNLVTDLPLGWTDEDTQYGVSILSDVLTRLISLVGDNWVVKSHSIQKSLDHELPYGTVFISTDNEVLIDGQPV